MTFVFKHMHWCLKMLKAVYIPYCSGDMWLGTDRSHSRQRTAVDSRELHGFFWVCCLSLMVVALSSHHCWCK
eukprot:378390-Amphidinium_carterae.1